ncbi:MAG: hypothetical protein ABIQ31_05040 [Ferruginibacter sp.]
MKTVTNRKKKCGNIGGHFYSNNPPSIYPNDPHSATKIVAFTPQWNDLYLRDLYCNYTNLFTINYKGRKIT